MLSWSKLNRVIAIPTERGRSVAWTQSSHSARTAIGTALVHERPDGQATLDMWKPDQSNIGTGIFPNVDAAKTRAETILDPRATCWDFVNAWCDDLDEAS